MEVRVGTQWIVQWRSCDCEVCALPQQIGPICDGGPRTAGFFREVRARARPPTPLASVRRDRRRVVARHTRTAAGLDRHGQALAWHWRRPWPGRVLCGARRERVARVWMGAPLSVVSRVRLRLAAQAGRGATSCRVRRGACCCLLLFVPQRALSSSMPSPALPCPSVDRRASLDRTARTIEATMSTKTRGKTSETSGRCVLFLLHPESCWPLASASTVPPAWPTLPSLRVACPS